ncbi:MAG TPA: right-handed parallel beta-helix repeat-containing protein, partial [Candidatus Hydrogenedentes bacterium]|nr:right-handed parallel beta-helix repeat-containing protein [Candidatus Hydrogenedentota bacterium]
PEANADKTDGPLATLAGARDKLRALRSQGEWPQCPTVIEARGGRYSLRQPLALGREDGGTQEMPVRYRATKGEEVRLVGGKVVPAFAPVTDEAALALLDGAAREHVVQADLKALGIDDFGPVPGGGIEVFFRDEPMRLSRWPNEGFTRIADIVVKDGHKIHGREGSKTGRFIYDGDRPRRWANEKDAWVRGYWFWDWSEQAHPIESIDIESPVIAVKEPYHGYGYRKGQWYYGMNLLSEVDSPGEWYIDREEGVLYLWPPAPIGEGDVVVSVLPTLVTFEDASHVVFEGFTLEAARGTAIRITGGAHCQIVGCTVRNVGSWAVNVSGGEGHGVVGCDMYNMGSGGISLTGGDRATLTPAGHYADNNHIHHYARINRVYHPGITLQGVGNRATHNLIHNTPHMGMGFGGNDHLIEYNEIHSVCYETNDAGAIYTGRNWTMRGHVIRHNYFHHISGFEARGCVGVYLDDMFCSADIVGNVFFNVTRAAMIGGGRHCSIVNNVFVDCVPAVHVDGRALGWAHGHADGWIEEAKEKGTLSGIAYDKPPYSTRWPELASMLDDEPKAPKHNRIERNICWRGKWDGIHAEAKPYVEPKDNLIQEDPLFAKLDRIEPGAKPQATDFALKPDSPAHKLGFETLPLEKMGLYEDANRASWPVTHEPRPAGGAGE